MKKRKRNPRGVLLTVMVPNRGVRRNPGWSDYVRGEWWITDDGESEFADQDIGEAGHERIALEAMLDADVLVDGLLEKELIDKEEAEESREDGAGRIITGYYVPDEVGIAAVVKSPSGASSTEVWSAIKRDIRVAYARYWGAIMGINREFAAWEFGDKQIKAVQDFVFEQSSGEDLDPDDAEICLEEIKTQRYECFSFDEFIVAKHARDLFTGQPR